MSVDHEAVTFALMRPESALEFPYAPDSDSLAATLHAYIPRLGTQGMGRLRAWFVDDFSALEPNPLADAVLTGVGYRHPHGWRGPVALTMEEDSDGRVRGLKPDIRSALEDLACGR